MQASPSMTSTNTGFDPIWYVVIGLIAFFILRLLRQNSLHRLISKYHLTQVADDIPGDFPTNSIDGIESFSQMSSAFYGSYGEDILVFLDIKIGSRQSVLRTIVARRFKSLPADPILKSSFKYQQIGQWRVVHGRGSLINPSTRLSPALIEQLWNLLAGPDHVPLDPESSMATSHPAEILIRPRKLH